MLPRLVRIAGLVLTAHLAWTQGLGHYPVRAFGFQEGLTNLSVNALVQDSNGFLLAGTEAGIFRFNGQRFESLPLRLPSRYVTALLPDPDGRIWVGTRNGLGYMTPDGTQFKVVEGLESRRVNHLGIDSHGQLWVMAGDRPFLAPDRKSLVTCASWPGVEAATDLFASPDSDEVLVSGTRSLWTWVPAQNRWVQERLPLLGPSEVLLLVGRDGTGALWVRSSRAFYRKLARQDRWEELPSQWGGEVPDAVQINRDRDGWLWINTLKGILRCRGDQIIPVQGGLTHDVPISALVDREGSTWLVSIGISQIVAQGMWTLFSREDGLPSNVVWNVATDSAGRTWAATDGGLVVGTDSGWRLVRKGQFSRLRPAPDGSIYAVGSPGGVLYRILPDARQVEEVTVTALPRTPVSRGLAIEPDGTVWVSDFRDGVACGRKSKGSWRWSQVTALCGKPLHGVWQILQASHGGIFLSTREGLYYKHEGNWSEIQGLLPESPFGAFLDPSGDIWVYYFNEPILTRHHWDGHAWNRCETWRPFRDRHDLVIFSNLIDGQGHLWLGTSIGLMKFDLGPRQLVTAYLPGEGIPGADATLQGLYLDPKGDLWYGTTEGLGRFHLAAEQPPPPLPVPKLIGWSPTPSGDAQNRPVFLPTHPLEARFALNTFALPGGLSLQARLLGTSPTEWTSLGDYRLAYAALVPGDYQLEVRGFRQPGTAGPPLVLNFQVAPEWWQTSWARIIQVLCLAGLIAGIIQIRHQALHKRNQELHSMVVARTEELAQANHQLEEASKAKSLFLASMSHELRTPLNAILLYSELVAEEARERGDESTRADLDKIQGAGRHLLSMINGILDLSKIEAGKVELVIEEISLPVLFQEVTETLRPLVQQGDNSFSTSIAPEIEQLRTDPTKLRQILLNLGGNACKFTHRGEIRLTARLEEDSLLLELADSGKGMSQETLTRIFGAFEQAKHEEDGHPRGTGLGLAISLRLAKLLGGDLTATSVLGKGSVFTVRLPWPELKAEA